MAELEEKLGEILGNPQLMQQIMALAQSMNPSPPGQPEQVKPNSPVQQGSPVSGVDLASIGKLAGLMRQTTVDRQQETLLRALSPYLSRERISKLDRAMQAAKLAQIASSFLNSGGLKMLTGR